MNTPSSQNDRSIKLRTRVALGFVSLAVLVSGLILGFVYLNFRNQLRESLRQRLVNIVTLAALAQDGGAFATISSPDDQEYQRVWAQNTAILESDADLVFVYTMRMDEEGLYFVVDAGDPTGDGFSSYGTRYYEPGPILSESYRTIQQPISEETFYQDEYGRFLSAYAPIVSDSGQVTGIIGADISANKIIDSERRLLLISLGIFAATLPVIALLGWWLGNNLASPIQTLTNVASRIAQGDLNYRIPINTRVPEIVLLNRSFYTMADQQQALILNLETRVKDRTDDLKIANEQVQIRANQLQSIAEIAHSVSLVQNIDEYLKAIVKIISERFIFYHVGIFLLDPTNEYTVLEATNSTGGQQMLARGHKLKVGEVGIVGYVAGSGKPRIALDVGQDAIFFNNPDLPETRSEMALPLSIKGALIGVIDIQSKEISAFKETDFEVFHILADQVATAIENSRLFTQAKQALAAAENTYMEYIRGGWSRFTQKNQKPSIRFSPQHNQIFDDRPEYPEINRVYDTGSIVAETKKGSVLAIPLTIRGEIIGVLDIRMPDKYDWESDEINTVQRISDRAALALENARLYEETRLKGSKEQTISEITSKISASINIRNVLQTAVEELGRAIPGSEVEVRLDTP